LKVGVLKSQKHFKQNVSNPGHPKDVKKAY
jgi:hypothetical protein